MNLLNLLLSSMTSQSSVNQVAGKTGLSKKQIQTLLTLAIPLLIKFMTTTASSGSGAQSLLGALAQHNNKKDMAEQLQEADTDDGEKIIGHIFGSQKAEVEQNLSAQSGLSAEQVNQILAIIAPAMMSGVSEAASDASLSQQNAKPTISLGNASGIFSALFGRKNDKDDDQEKDDSINGVALLQALLGARR